MVSGKFNNAKEAKNMYLNNVYGDEEKLRKSDNRTDHRKDMIEVYDQVRKFFITPSPIPDMDYVPTSDKSNEDEKDYELTLEQPDTTNVSDLQGTESAEERKKEEAKGLKISTPEQMLSRLPISLAHLKAGNTSEKLKNEIRHLLYYLYRSKKLRKTIYKDLMNTIIKNVNSIYEHFK